MFIEHGGEVRKFMVYRDLDETGVFKLFEDYILIGEFNTSYTNIGLFVSYTIDLPDFIPLPEEIIEQIWDHTETCFLKDNVYTGIVFKIFSN